MNTKESGWKVYEYSIIGGVKVIAKNPEDAENFAEYEASGSWELELDSETPIETASISGASATYHPHPNSGADCDFHNFNRLSPQAQRAVQNLIDKLLSE